jgi:hypothetical protein
MHSQSRRRLPAIGVSEVSSGLVLVKNSGRRTILTVDSELFRNLVEIGTTNKGDGTFFPQVPQQLKHLLGGLL